MTGSRLELDNQSKSVYSRKGEELAYLLGNKKNHTQQEGRRDGQRRRDVVAHGRVQAAEVDLAVDGGGVERCEVGAHLRVARHPTMKSDIQFIKE